MAGLGILPTEAGKIAALPILWAFATKDMWHDFTGAKLEDALALVGTSYDPSSKLTLAKYALNLKKLQINIKSKVWTNASAMFGPHMEKILPKGAFEELKGDENSAAAKLGFSLVTLRDTLTQTPTEYAGALGSVTTIGNALVNNYNISVCATKVRSERKSIAGAFSKVAPGAKELNFVIIIDATFIGMSELQLTSPPNGEIHNYYLINSLENDSDPAEKLKKIDTPKAPNINIYYLKDIGYTSNYAAFMSSLDQLSNLFTTLSLKSYRTNDDKIAVDITRTDGSKITINDVGTSSEINRATFLALKLCVEIGWDGLGPLQQSVWEEILLYFLLKRAGDWCQALCLLDRDRLYTILNLDKSPYLGGDGRPMIVSLNILKQQKSMLEILLMTHDRILLAFALYLGLNVGYSIRTVVPGIPTDQSTSATWLVYIKNQVDAVIDPATLEAKRQEVSPLFESRISAKASYTILSTINGQIAAILSALVGLIPGIFSTNFGDYMKKIRLILNLLKQLTPTTEYTMLIQGLEAKSIPTATYIELLQIKSSLDKLDTIITTHQMVGLCLNSFIRDAASPEEAAARTAAMTWWDTQKPSTFISELESIATIHGLLNGPGVLISASREPTKEYQLFKGLVLTHIKSDLKIVVSIHADWGVGVRKILGPVRIPAGLSRTLGTKYTAVMTDINTELGLTQIGGGSGDQALILNIQNNIIALTGNYEPYDLSDSTDSINRMYAPGTEQNSVAIGRRDYYYNVYIGKGIKEPTISDLVITIVTDEIALGGPLPPETISKIEADYGGNSQYNILRYGMKIIDENNESYTIVDKFLILPQQAQHFKTIIESGQFENPYSMQFLLWRFPLFLIDYCENKIRSLPYYNVDNEDYQTNNRYTYEDNTLNDLRTYYSPIGNLLAWNVNYNPGHLITLVNYFYKGTPIPQVMIPRDVTRDTILFDIATVRLMYILQYYDAIRKTLEPNEWIDLVLNILPPNRFTESLAIFSSYPIIQESIKIASYLLKIDYAKQLFLPQGDTFVSPDGDPRTVLEMVFQALYYASQNLIYYDRISPLLNIFNGIYAEDRYTSLRAALPLNPAYSTFKQKSIIHGNALVHIILSKGAATSIPYLVSTIYEGAVNIAQTTVDPIPANFALIAADLTADVTNTLWLIGTLSSANIEGFIASLQNPELVKSFIVSKEIIYNTPTGVGAAPSGGARKTRSRRRKYSNKTRSKRLHRRGRRTLRR